MALWMRELSPVDGCHFQHEPFALKQCLTSRTSKSRLPYLSCCKGLMHRQIVYNRRQAHWSLCGFLICIANEKQKYKSDGRAWFVSRQVVLSCGDWSRGDDWPYSEVLARVWGGRRHAVWLSPAHRMLHSSIMSYGVPIMEKLSVYCAVCGVHRTFQFTLLPIYTYPITYFRNRYLLTAIVTVFRYSHSTKLMTDRPLPLTCTPTTKSN